MPLIERRYGILRGQLRPGDILLQLNPRSELGPGWSYWGLGNPILWLISSLSEKYGEYVHGGIAIGDGKIIEVSGGLPKDGWGNWRLWANIYVTDLNTELRSYSYDVFRCIHGGLAKEVAAQACPFAVQGTDVNSWNYNLTDALASVDQSYIGTILGQLSFSRLSSRSGNIPHEYDILLDEGTNALDIANAEKRQFFCTQFVVWLYNLVAERICNILPLIPIPPTLAYPGALAESLNNSGSFYYVGSIRGY